MIKQEEQKKYNAIFPTILRTLMEKTNTTQKNLAEAVGTRPQSISCYAIGKTQPSPSILLEIAKYFDVSVDYLLTGLSYNHVDIHKELGLSEESIERLKYIKRMESFEENTHTIDILNDLLSDNDFYKFLDDLNFKTNVIKEYNSIPDEKQNLVGNLDLEKYYILDLQMYIHEFIKSMLLKNGIKIENK